MNPQTETAPSPSLVLPKNVLLATDLSCRCDRPLDRAIAISKAWGSHLTALTVVDKQSFDGIPLPPGDTADPVQRARRRLRRDVSSASGGPSILVRAGDVLDELLDVVTGNGMELVVTGVARNQWFRNVTLGTVVDGILRRSPVPTLVVRNRANEEYRRILVAGDFSDLTRHLLETTLAWFPEADVTFFHAFDVPYLDLSDASRDIVREQARKEANKGAAEFLAGIPATLNRRSAVRSVCEFGLPVVALNNYSLRTEVDLVVIGNHGRSVFFEILTGSNAKDILQNVESDVLVLPEPA